MNENKAYSKTILLSFSVIIVLYKIAISHYYYPNEDFFLKIIRDIESMQFMPLIKSYSQFNFSPDFELTQSNDYQNLAFPYLSVILHSLLLNIMGLSSFYLLEIIGIFLFLLIFYKILRLTNFSKNISIIISILLFTIPNIVPEITFTLVGELKMAIYNLKNLYNTRMPRPLISSLYFYAYILMIIKIYCYNSYSYKNSIFLGLLSGFSLHAFFYFAFIQYLFLIITIAGIYKIKSISHILNNKKFYLIFIGINFLFLITILIIMKFISVDNYRIIGFHDVNLDQKLILLKTFFKYISNKYFIIIFLICYLLNIKMKKYEKNLQIFFYLYIASIFSFFLFLLIYNKIIHYYYFQNLIIITSFIFIFLSTLKILEKKFNYFRNKTYFQTLIIFLILIITNNYINHKNFINKNKSFHPTRVDDFGQQREEFSKLVEFINNDKFFNNKQIQILTLDTNIFSVLYLKNYKNFTIVPNSFWTVRSISRIEEDLFKSFKILGLNENQFIEIFNNDDLGYRITGKYTNNFFGLIYLANKIIKYSDYDDYLIKESNKIKKTSPFRTQQFVIPQSEYTRLRENFNKYIQTSNDVDLIIIDKYDKITKKYNIDENKFCKIYINTSYVVYKNKLHCR